MEKAVGFITEDWIKSNNGDFGALREMAHKMGNLEVYDSIEPRSNLQSEMVSLLETSSWDKVTKRFAKIMDSKSEFFHSDYENGYEEIHDWNEYLQKLVK